MSDATVSTPIINTPTAPVTSTPTVPPTTATTVTPTAETAVTPTVPASVTPTATTPVVNNTTAATHAQGPSHKAPLLPIIREATTSLDPFYIDDQIIPIFASCCMITGLFLKTPDCYGAHAKGTCLCVAREVICW